MSKTIPISILRGLLKEQNGKCAISGRKLNPNEVQGDHIIPLSRKELNPTYGKENVWLVSSEINRIKHNLSYKELVNACREILNNEKRTRELLNKIQSGKIEEIEKKDFDKWVDEKFDNTGIIKENE